MSYEEAAQRILEEFSGGGQMPVMVDSAVGMHFGSVDV